LIDDVVDICLSQILKFLRLHFVRKVEVIVGKLRAVTKLLGNELNVAV